MKKLILFTIILNSFLAPCQNPSRVKEGIDTKFILLDTLTTQERDAVNVSTRAIIYNIDTNTIEFWDGDSWEPIANDLEQEVPNIESTVSLATSSNNTTERDNWFYSYTGTGRQLAFWTESDRLWYFDWSSSDWTRLAKYSDISNGIFDTTNEGANIGINQAVNSTGLQLVDPNYSNSYIQFHNDYDNPLSTPINGYDFYQGFIISDSEELGQKTFIGQTESGFNIESESAISLKSYYIDLQSSQPIKIETDGSPGTNGQVLTSDGNNAYWNDLPMLNGLFNATNEGAAIAINEAINSTSLKLLDLNNYSNSVQFHTEEDNPLPSVSGVGDDYINAIKFDYEGVVGIIGIDEGPALTIDSNESINLLTNFNLNVDVNELQLSINNNQGTNGQVLTSDGNDASWQDLPIYKDSNYGVLTGNEAVSNQNLLVDVQGGGVILTSPNGTKFLLSIDDNGYLKLQLAQ